MGSTASPCRTAKLTRVNLVTRRRFLRHLAAAATVASAAAGKPGGVKIFRMGLSGDATEMDPVRSTTEANNPPAEALYNYVGRYTYHPPLGTQILPELAEG
jgi:hypothetical protein